ncbi:MAG: hypothetical protein ACUVXD_08430 [Thermodesulfobacteriota bacterium]
MDIWERIQRLQALVMEMGLPRHEMAHFGVSCPYCGKTDRIYTLEEPSELDSAPDEYGQAWAEFAKGGKLVLCRFCRQVLCLEPGGKARPLVDDS